LFIERAEALGEPAEDPLLLFPALYGSCVVSFAALDGDVVRELAGEFLALAEERGTTVPLMVGHRITGTRTTISRSRFTCLPSIVRWLRVLP
jgi:hypothetical protein